MFFFSSFTTQTLTQCERNQFSNHVRNILQTVIKIKIEKNLKILKKSVNLYFYSQSFAPFSKIQFEFCGFHTFLQNIRRRFNFFHIFHLFHTKTVGKLAKISRKSTKNKPFSMLLQSARQWKDRSRLDLNIFLMARRHQDVCAMEHTKKNKNFKKNSTISP